MEAFLRAVRFNCLISDAKYWGHFSICGFLMRLRDLFRAEKGLMPWDQIPQEEIGQWLSEREERWKGLEEAEYVDIPVDGVSYRSFDVAEINRRLASAGLAYGAGYGLYMKPTFFVAEVSARSEQHGYSILVLKRELARDLFSSSGMSRDRTIYVRLDALRTYLWEKISESIPRADSCVVNMLRDSGVDPLNPRGSAFEQTFEGLVTSYANVILHHEVAEQVEDAPEWSNVLLSTQDRALEYFFRGIEDLLADTSPSGPLSMIIEKEALGLLCLFREFLGSHQKRYFPEFVNSYLAFRDSGDWAALELARSIGYTRCRNLRDHIVDLYRLHADSPGFVTASRNLLCRCTQLDRPMRRP